MTKEYSIFSAMEGQSLHALILALSAEGLFQEHGQSPLYLIGIAATRPHNQTVEVTS
jgi:hypothetical protein